VEVQATVRHHPVFQAFMLDPYTNRAFSKPRGFAGDAELIDLFYGFSSAPVFSTVQGRSIFEELMRLPSCDSVRYRRSLYGQFVDDIAMAASEKATVLSLACGHLREIGFSKAAADKGKVKIIGIDSDPLAIEEAERYLSGKDVELKNASIIEFIRRRAWGQKFNGVYSAGLFDYLDEKIARKVITTAFESLLPGGKLWSAVSPADVQSMTMSSARCAK
jgi:extracellular factor (EF) 3-hydroxypalmitic acid methyl ester biosynthesis protein